MCNICYFCVIFTTKEPEQNKFVEYDKIRVGLFMGSFFFEQYWVLFGSVFLWVELLQSILPLIWCDAIKIIGSIEMLLQLSKTFVLFICKQTTKKV